MSEHELPAARAPVEKKVLASAAGAAGSAAVATFLIWLLGAGVWSAGWSADQVDNAIAAVPTPVTGLILLGLGSLGTFLAGYAAPHTPRG